MQSISTQLPSLAIIWFTLVNTTGTNPLPAVVPFPSVTSDRASAAQEARRDATRRRRLPEECIVTNCRCVVTPQGRDSFLSAVHLGYLSITEGSLVVSCAAGDMALDRGREPRRKGGKKNQQTYKQKKEMKKETDIKKHRKTEINTNKGESEKQENIKRRQGKKKTNMTKKQTNKEGKKRKERKTNKHAGKDYEKGNKHMKKQRIEKVEKVN